MNARIEIVSIGNKGQGVGKDAEGNTYFVNGLFPGDIAEVEALSDGPFREAISTQLIEASSDRVKSECNYAAECGGCDWIEWKYESQVAAKARLLEYTLNRFGFEPKKIHPFKAAETTHGYRTRIQVRTENGTTGFLKRQSQDIVDVESCWVAHPALNEKLGQVRATPPTGERTKVEIGLGDDGQAWTAFNQRHAAQGFTQVHEGQNDELKAIVANAMKNAHPHRVLELFAGDGNLTFGSLGGEQSWIGIEIDQAGVYKGRAQAAALNLPEERVKFVRADLFSEGAAARCRVYGCDTLMLDPPRSGMGKRLKAFVGDSINNLIYVSCSLQSFVTDATFLKNDFTLEEVWGIDMFPHTRHFEMVARFRRR